MAKFTPGPGVAAVSGSIGGTVFSRNRYGAYMRYRAIPTNPDTEYQANVRQALGASSENWRSLTDAQRMAWATWAANNPITDMIGQSQILAANAAYVQLNARLAYMGETLLDLPPVAAAPAPLESITVDTDIGAGDFQVAFTATPLGAGVRLFGQVAVVNSAGIKYVKNIMRTAVLTAAAQASPLTGLQALVEARFGTLQVGQVVHLNLATIDEASGLVSTPLRAVSTVVTT